MDPLSLAAGGGLPGESSSATGGRTGGIQFNRGSGSGIDPTMLMAVAGVVAVVWILTK